jgi:hypothetical protein
MRAFGFAAGLGKRHGGVAPKASFPAFPGMRKPHKPRFPARGFHLQQQAAPIGKPVGLFARLGGFNRRVVKIV